MRDHPAKAWAIVCVLLLADVICAAAEPPNPTSGICSQAPPGSGFVDDLAAAEDAHRAGCYQQAMRAINRAAADPAARTQVRLARAQLVSLEIRASALGEGYDDDAPLTMSTIAHRYHSSPPWLAALALNEPSPSPLLDLEHAARLEKEVRNGKLEAVVPPDRLARVLLRSTLASSCLQTIFITGPEARANDANRLSAVRSMLLDFKKTPALVAELSRAALWGCDAFELASLQARKAAAELESNGQTEAGQWLRLDAIERLGFPGGRAGDFGIVDNSPESMRRTVVAEELPDDVAAKTDRQLVVFAEGRVLTPAVAARWSWLRGVNRLFAMKDARKAAALAQQSQRSAESAKRSDLLDAARVLELFAQAERGDWSGAQALVALLDRSLSLRGALGARTRLADHLDTRAWLALDHGQPVEAVDWARLATGLHSLPPGEHFAVDEQLVQVLESAGYLEEAVAESSKTLRSMRPANNPPAGLEPNIDYVRYQGALTLHFKLLAKLGRLDAQSLGDSEPILSRELKALHAFARGQLDTVAPSPRSLRPDTIEERAVIAAGIDSGYCDFVFGYLSEVEATLASVARDPMVPMKDMGAWIRDGAGNVLKIYTLRPFAGRLAVCASALRDKKLLAVTERVRDVISKRLTLEDDTLGGLAAAARADVEGRFGAAAAGYLALARRSTRQASNDQASRIAQGQAAGPLFQRAALSALRAGDASTAVSALEESRSSALRLARAAAADRKRSGKATAQVSTIEKTLGALERRQRLLSLTPPSPQREATLAALRQEIERQSLAHEVAAAAMARDSPASYRAAALEPMLTAETLQSRLSADQALVYWLVEPDEARAIILTRGSVRSVELAARDAHGRYRLFPDIRRLVTTLHERSGGRGVAPDDRPAKGELHGLQRSLYDRLVAPLEPLITRDLRVLIVPDAGTAAVPFAALLDSNDQPWIARNPLRYLPGGHVLSANHSAAQKLAHALIAGDPDFGARHSSERRGCGGEIWQQLPGSRAEAQAIANLWHTRPLIGTDASEENVVRGLNGKDVLHVASHACADAAVPSLSALILSLPRRGSTHDGILHAWEVEQLALTAQVVVLSACDTGNGQPRGSEGVLSLERAFLLAGTESVVSSLWLVPDQPTARLMIDFHQRIRSGESGDRALAAAMLAARTSDDDPVAWAAFRIVGVGLP